MEAVPRVTVPLRTGKKMKKRKELDALVAHTVSKRGSGSACASSHDQLLTESSDEWTESGACTVIGCGKSPKPTRRRRQFRFCASLVQTCGLFMLLTSFISSTCLVWLFSMVRQQVTSLRGELSQVVAEHRGVPDEIQECHMLTRNLQRNQTQIIDRLSAFSFLLGNLTVNTTNIQKILASVQEQLKTSPNFANDQSLVNTVASFGSQIQDLNATVARLKLQAISVETLSQNFIVNLTSLVDRINVLEKQAANAGSSSFTEMQFAKEKDAILAVISQAGTNLTIVNDTLTKKLQWTSDDQLVNHKNIENLQEMNQNITTRLSTLEDICKQKTTGNVNSGVQEVTPSASINGLLTSGNNQSNTKIGM